MKKLLTLITLTLLSIYSYSQSPQGVNYQAVARDASGSLMVNQSVNVQLLIKKQSVSGPTIYIEDHTPSTNSYGLFTLVIGEGIPLSGVFSNINWGDTTHYLEVKVNGSSVGTTQFMSVPYALHAKTVEIDMVNDADADNTNELQTLNRIGNTIYISNGNSILLPPDNVNDADYNPTNEIQTLTLSGNSLSISNGNNVTLPNPTEIKDGDSDTRVKTDNGSDNDEVSIFLKNTEEFTFWRYGIDINTSSNNGADIFIGNAAGRGLSTTFPTYDQSNVGIGDSALYNGGKGKRNVALGKNAMKNSTMYGYDNVAIGTNTLQNNIWGKQNIGIGKNALLDNGNGGDNIALGESALSKNTGSSNIAIGKFAMLNKTTTSGNIAIGDESLKNYNPANNSYSANIAIGTRAMEYDSTSIYTVAIGYEAGKSLSVKDLKYSLLLGYKAKANINNLTNVIAIGKLASVNTSNTAVIGNSSMVSIGGYDTWSNLSDARFKTNINKNVVGLDFIMKLTPVTYNLNITKLNKFLNVRDDSEDFAKGIADKEAITYTGFLAQDVEKSAKAVGYNFSGVSVPKNEKDHYKLKYAEFVVPLVKATQEQQSLITKQQKQIDLLTKQVELLMKKLEDK